MLKARVLLKRTACGLWYVEGHFGLRFLDYLLSKTGLTGHRGLYAIRRVFTSTLEKED